MAGVTSVVIDGTTYLVDDINAVDFSEDQGLSEQQQQQGRSNIGAAAETALAGLEGTVGKLSDDVNGLTEALSDKASAIVDTASGAIASFPDGAAVPAKDITIGIEPVQSGSGDPSPTNVRPISGWTGANVTRTGVNIWDEEWESGYYDANGNPVSSAAQIRSKNLISVVPGLQYYAKMASHRFCYYDASKQFISRSDLFKLQDNLFTIPDNCYYIKFHADQTGGIYNNDISINYPSTDNAYHPGHVQTIPISWQAEAGTVYGGTLDVTTGLLTVTMAEVDLGTLEWTYNGTRKYFNSEVISNIRTPSSITEVTDWAMCSIYKPTASTRIYGDAVNHDCEFAVFGGGYPGISDQRFSDAASFKTAMSGVQLVYELATPQTYQLSPTDVALLLGVNNVWADTGDSTVTYRADTKLYIQKINTPSDDDMIADAQIASGKYFIVGGNLYKSTTTIPAGDTINPGSNCILTNLADALNALNT